MSELSSDYNFTRLAKEGETEWQHIFNRFKTELLKRGSRISSEDLNWLIDNVYALPNSPALLTAGDSKGFFASACSSYPVFDTMRGHPFSILNVEGISNDATVAGIGVGFNFSQLRGKSESVRGRTGITGGPVSFLRKYSGSLGEITQATRKSACMGTLDIHHPDVLDFIQCKKEDGKINNFNLSILGTDEFMEAVINDTEFDVRPIKGASYKAKARPVFDAACEYGWRYGGEPAWIFTGNVKRDYFIENIEPYQILNNPCQPGFATVLTPEGIRTFDDIDVGSVIWSGKQWTKVTKKWCTGIKPVYQYDTTAGQFMGTEDHHIIQNGERIKVKDAVSIDPAICEDFDDRNIKIDPQDVMDGLVLGDGSIHKASGNLKILHIGEKDGDYHASEISHLIIKHRPGIGKTVWTVNTTIELSELVYTYNRKIPDRFMYGSVSKRVGFLRGLFTANGCVTSGRVQYKCASRVLAEQVQFLLSSLGMRSSLVINKPATVQHRNGVYTSKESYNIILYQHSYKFMNLIGFLQKYKQEADIAFKERVNKSTSDIRKRTFLGDYKVYDITVEAEEHTYWTGGLLVSNCQEAILSYGHDDKYGWWLELCALASINLPRYTRLSAEEKKKVVRLVVFMLNDIIDVQDYVSEYQKIGMQNINRKIGIGYAGIATLLATRGVKYSSEEGRQALFDIQTEIAQYAIEASSTLGDVHGLGRYNASLFSIAPTSTLSNIFNYFNEEGCSYGIEPYFSIAPYTVKNSYGEFQKVDKIVTFLQGKTDHIEVANDLTWQAHVGMVEAAMKASPKGTMQSISKTINFKNNVTLEEYKEAIVYCWKHGIKGISLYRDQSRKNQVISTTCKDRPTCIEYKSAPKRPQSLPCDIHHVSYKEQKWVVLVGLLCDRPFEVFAGLEENIELPKRHKTGTIRSSGKKGNKKYDLHIGEGDDALCIRDIPKAFNNENFCTWTRQISMNLRHGVEIKYWVEQVGKSEDFSSFLRVIARILKKYIKDGSEGELCSCGGKMTYVQGCQTCLQCGKSKCG